MSKTVNELFEEVIENNFKLLKLLEGMSPEDRKEYAPKVELLILSTGMLRPTTKIVGEDPTMLHQQLTWDESEGDYPDIKKP